jgi:hypothetical protein
MHGIVSHIFLKNRLRSLPPYWVQNSVDMVWMWAFKKIFYDSLGILSLLFLIMLFVLNKLFMDPISLKD